jgi:hypothetical protein
MGHHSPCLVVTLPLNPLIPVSALRSCRGQPTLHGELSRPSGEEVLADELDPETIPMLSDEPDPLVEGRSSSFAHTYSQPSGSRSPSASTAGKVKHPRAHGAPQRPHWRAYCEPSVGEPATPPGGAVMTTGYTTGNPARDDAISTLVEKLVIATTIATVTLIALPLVIPTLARKVAGEQIATRARFWMTARSQNVAAVIGAVLVLALVATEVLLLVRAIRHGQLQLQPGLVGVLLPWLVGNLCSGVLLLPAAWVLHRLRIAELVRTRRISDVLRQTRIEQARKRAADATAAARIGVHVHPATGKITGVRPNVITAPHTTPAGEAFAFVTRSTVITFAERFHERRQVRDWLTPNGDLLVLPQTSSAVRALLVAESGSGKTVLLDSLILCALEYGWPVFFLDAKGDPADATHLAALATGRGKTAEFAGPWNLFAGTADQVTAKLMRLMPSPDGANQHYLDEIRGVFWDDCRECVEQVATMYAEHHLGSAAPRRTKGRDDLAILA